MEKISSNIPINQAGPKPEMANRSLPKKKGRSDESRFGEALAQAGSAQPLVQPQAARAGANNGVELSQAGKPGTPMPDSALGAAGQIPQQGMKKTMAGAIGTDLGPTIKPETRKSALNGGDESQAASQMASAMISPAAMAMASPGASMSAKAQNVTASATGSGSAKSLQTPSRANTPAHRPTDSMTTAAAIAGLNSKPWSTEWVFDGKQLGPAPKPLFGTADSGSFEEPALTGKMAPANPNVMSGFEPAFNLGAPVMTQGKPAQGTLESADQYSLSLARGDAATASEKASVQPMGIPLAMNHEAQINQAIAAGSVKLDGTPDGLSTDTQLRFRQEGGPTRGLTGSEFMSTLGSVRGETANANSMAMENGLNQGGPWQNPMAAGQEARASRVMAEVGTKGGNSPFGTQLARQGRSIGEASAKPRLDKEAALSGEVPAFAGAHHLSTGSGATGTRNPQMVEVSGQVVPGTMARERLSSDALLGVAGGINNLSSQGGGEMRIRLKPENLGELHVRVATNGREVGLQIQASDEKARKILEESMSSLKESLAGHRLTLGKVDLIVNQPSVESSRASNDSQWNDNGQRPGFQASYQQGQDASQSNQRGHESWMGQDGGAGLAFSSRPLRSSGSSAETAGMASRRAARAPGRLDVMA